MNTAVMPRPEPPADEELVLVGRVSGMKFGVPLKGDEFKIGTAPGNDLRLIDKYVSGFHCRLFKKDGRWWIEDLNSKNGTKLRGLRIGGSELGKWAIIEMGSTHWTLRNAADEDVGWPGFYGIVSEDTAMIPIFNEIEKRAQFDDPVLITGETGTDKEKVAEAIHKLSRRAWKKFLSYDFSGSPSKMHHVVIDLFGKKRNEYPSLDRDKPGLFDEADGGTIFIDEICEAHQGIQPAILRVLDNNDLRKMGMIDDGKLGTRIVAGTHIPLENMVGDGFLREGLYYSLKPFEIVIPPLRERPADIPLLAEYYIHNATKDSSKKELSEAALKKLCRYRYPGNDMELKQVICKAVEMSTEDVIEEKEIDL